MTFTRRKYRDAIAAVGLSQRAAAKFLAIDERTSRRYACGELEVPDPIAMLLTIMHVKRVSPQHARQLTGLSEVIYDVRELDNR